MPVIPLSDIPCVRILGRSPLNQDGLTLFWPASGIEFLFSGSSLCLDYRADFSSMEPWLSAELNGRRLIRMPLNKGEGRVCLFRGMRPGLVKHIRILKDTQAMYDDPQQLLQFQALAFPDGAFKPLKEAPYYFEFIGDSITSGEGAIGAPCEEDWISAFFTVIPNYAVLTADAFGADFSLISHSGWGLVSNWANNIHCTIPGHYELLCGPARGPRNRALGAQEAYDFTSRKTDAVLINLGTNDAAAFDNPPFYDPESGRRYKLRRLPDGRRHPEDEEKIIRRTEAFLKTLRRLNPEAALIWLYGMLGNGIADLAAEGIRRYRAETKDPRVFMHKLPEMTEAGRGARQHPGAPAHRAAAASLISFLQEKGFCPKEV